MTVVLILSSGVPVLVELPGLVPVFADHVLVLQHQTPNFQEPGFGTELPKDQGHAAVSTNLASPR